MKYSILMASLALCSCAPEQGIRGKDGKDARPCTVINTSQGALISCPDGSKAIVANGQKGATGQTGSAGAPGAKGEDGQGCSVTEGTGGVEITCGNDTQITLPPQTDFSLLDFCPELGGGIGFEEWGLRISGALYAVYADGTHTFLTQLHPGNYQTTDGRNCHFTVNNDLSVSY